MRRVFMLAILLCTSVSAAVETTTFSNSVDMGSWSERVAVFSNGRVKSFETFARSYMSYILGPRKFENQHATFTYFDMLIRPERYANQSIVYVKHKGLRAAIIDAANQNAPDAQATLQLFMETGLIPQEVLQEDDVTALLNTLRQDVRRYATPVEQIESAMYAANPQMLWSNLKIIPPDLGRFDEPWSTITQHTNPEILTAWENLITAWTSENAEQVNELLNALSIQIPALANGADIYPNATKLKLESVYFRLNNFTAIWIVYLISIVLLLMAFVYRFKNTGRIGLTIFVLAVLLNTVAVIWRWYVSGRYPNTNMFEAITTAAWMGGLFGVMMEYLVRKTSMRYLFSLGASITAMVALLAVRLYPLELNPHVSNKMPVLHDIWLYIHVNFIIFSYCLIFVAAVTATIYLLRRGLQVLQRKDGSRDYARAGGVASLVEIRPGKSTQGSSNAGSVLDGATMILVELAFILLWTGIGMGAIWADHSWGRPWGWDPKEVFALNTFLIFVVLIHSRFKVKDKGLWTAWLALIGCAVMLFNWIIINFTISGLHSYA